MNAPRVLESPSPSVRLDMVSTVTRMTARKASCDCFFGGGGGEFGMGEIIHQRDDDDDQRHPHLSLLPPFLFF